MSGHTRGPWEIAPAPDDAEMLEVMSDYSEDGLGRKWARWIAQVDADGLDGDHDEMRANARLIAAAPDLLNQLIACRHFLLAYMDGDLVSYDRAKQDDTWPHLLLRDIEIAIAKATGGDK